MKQSQAKQASCRFFSTSLFKCTDNERYLSVTVHISTQISFELKIGTISDIVESSEAALGIEIEGFHRGKSNSKTSLNVSIF